MSVAPTAEEECSSVHLILGAVNVPYPSWLNPADNTWQITAATFVGLMSLPALAVLYASLVQKKWAVNVLAMMFAGFSLVLVAWVLWTYQIGFGANSLGHGVINGHINALVSKQGWWDRFWDNFEGRPGQALNSYNEQGQAVSNANSLIPFHFPTDSLLYFQFVFGAITPLLFMGSVLGRIKFSAWCLLVPLWSTFVYGVDAFLLWGGGYFAQEGAVDYSGGFVIHMSAGVSGFVAAWVLGPRLARDRQHALPNNLVMAAVGAGILWLGWNGFNGGDPYYAGSDMAAAVVNTNIATAVGVLTWMGLDAWLSKARKPTFLGGVNGMICGLVGITPCAGWVNGWGAIAVGLIDTCIVWIAWNYLSKVRPFSKVDDALGVIYTHGIAGLFGGLMVGIFADPNMIEYGCGNLDKYGQVVNTGYLAYRTSSKSCTVDSISGLMYTGSAHQLWEQFRAAIFVIIWSALITFILMQIIKLVLRGARYKDEILMQGDVAIHDEEAFPEEGIAVRSAEIGIGLGVGMDVGSIAPPLKIDTPPTAT
ncbi:MAG TPA: ammonium transporter [Acidimicrobiales bacterium]|nr:ammonium transporter [Acidimicrobiales bacterium]